MPTYRYSCGSCGTAFERFARFEDFKASLECGCGQQAEVTISGGAAPIVRGMGEYKFDPRKNCRSFRGRSGKREEKHYEKVIETQRQLVKARRKAGKERDDGWTFEGIMPAPMAQSIGAHEGDIEAVMKDPVPFLKATGTYMGED